MDLRSELQTIYQQHERLTPELVVQVAAPPDHPLHERFEWDDSKAGAAYRESQAADLIRSVRVVYAHGSDGEAKSARAFVAPRAPGRPHEYVPTEEALTDEFTRAIVLREFQRAIAGLRRQYGHLQEYSALLDAEVQQQSA